MNNPKRRSKKKAKVKCKDSPPHASITVKQDGSSDVVLTASAPVLVSETQDSSSTSSLAPVTPSPHLLLPQPIIHFTDDCPSVPTTAALAAISDMASGSW
jgi:hypothetical protein